MDRQVRRRLAVLRHVEEVSGNVAMTCRYYGISRQTDNGWLRRYEAEGIDGLRDRSKRPRSSPNATRVEVVEKILHLRQQYHLGPRKIVMYLVRCPDVTISVSGVGRIPHRLDMGRLPASQRYKRHDRRWKRYEKQRPGHQVQIDVKFRRRTSALPQSPCARKTPPQTTPSMIRCCDHRMNPRSANGRSEWPRSAARRGSWPVQVPVRTMPGPSIGSTSVAPAGRWQWSQTSAVCNWPPQSRCRSSRGGPEASG